jgi:hypothetical protein
MFLFDERAYNDAYDYAKTESVNMAEKFFRLDVQVHGADGRLWTEEILQGYFISNYLLGSAGTKVSNLIELPWAVWDRTTTPVSFGVAIPERTNAHGVAVYSSRFHRSEDLEGVLPETHTFEDGKQLVSERLTGVAATVHEEYRTSRLRQATRAGQYAVRATDTSSLAVVSFDLTTSASSNIFRPNGEAGHFETTAPEQLPVAGE